MSILELINNKIYNIIHNKTFSIDGFNNVLKSFFEEAKTPYLFDSALIVKILNENNQIILQTINTELNKILLDYIDKYIINLKEIDNNLLILFRLNLNLKNYSFDVGKKIQHFIKKGKLYKDLINRIVIDFHIPTYPRINIKEITDIYENLENFENYIGSLEKDDFLNEFNEFYKETKNQGFEPFEKKFTYIKPD